ncbi:jmjc domain-containing protein c2orf60 [Cystoisospora suis]|uniref:Jmjc domain-containing protein c2orf60 n=1 Tax=Cystoisospora suis TaxID=483139 RepID=A0A2C6L6D9_9APIC|nr:jmjc domain-containing protein c2orf60 [Cystoisospora suis]
MLPPLHELCQTCRATIQSRISSSSSSFSSFFSSPLHSSSSPSSSGSLCSSSSASCESRDSSIQAGEKKKQNHLLDGGEEEEACCVSVNVFFLDRSLPSHEKIYAKKDIYGNKDGSAYTEALNDVQRTILPRLSNLPSPWSSFYLRKLSLELESMAEALEKREEGGG